jgi:hypothetical protein
VRVAGRTQVQYCVGRRRAFKGYIKGIKSVTRHRNFHKNEIVLCGTNNMYGGGEGGTGHTNTDAHQINDVDMHFMCCQLCTMSR